MVTFYKQTTFQLLFYYTAQNIRILWKSYETCILFIHPLKPRSCNLSDHGLQETKTQKFNVSVS